MSHDTSTTQPLRLPPPSKHQLAIMIWTAVFPTLTVINLVLLPTLSGLPVVVRTFILSTIAVPIVIYLLMPQLYRARGHLLDRSARAGQAAGPLA